MGFEDEEEVLAEVEAVQAVYGSDCLLLDSSPPRLHIRMKPRTADISSEQFVEAVIQIQAGLQYPKEPPDIHLVDSKGLDERRKMHLMNCMLEKARELSPGLILVALCEEAVEKLSSMNHPDGDCPLCLYPLVSNHQQTKTPFMKLMSCFHCFHSECIIRWWTWLEKMKPTNSGSTVLSERHADNQKDMHGNMAARTGNCPVCRKAFHANDLEHVLKLVDKQSSRSNLDENDSDFDRELLQSELENIRRQKFETVLRLQEANNGIIEPKKDIVVMPGVFLPRPATTVVPVKETPDQRPRDVPAGAGTGRGTHSIGTLNGPSSSGRRNFSTRNQKIRNPRRPVQQWVRKDN